nr:hypothetical protein [Tanacetum cinerariifolium]
KIDFDKKESARFNKKKVRCYKCQQRGYFAKECRAKGGNDKQRYSSFKIKEIGKKEEDSKALITVDTLVDWTNHESKSDGVITAQEFGMIVGCDSKDAIKEGAAKLYNMITGANSEEANTAGDGGEFALMGVTSETAKKDVQTKLNSPLVQTEKWRNSSKNLFKLIDSSIDKSLEVNTNDFASSDSSVKSLEHKPTDSTSSVSTSINEDEIESNVGTHIKEPIIVQDLPSFTCNSSDKNEHTSRTSCKKNGYFNKKAGHFRKNASSVSKLYFICGSGTHIIKDYDFYEKQMANKTIGIGTGKVHIPPVRPQPVPIGKPKVTPVPTGKPKVTTAASSGSELWPCLRTGETGSDVCGLEVKMPPIRQTNKGNSNWTTKLIPAPGLGAEIVKLARIVGGPNSGALSVAVDRTV